LLKGIEAGNLQPALFRTYIMQVYFRSLKKTMIEDSSKLNFSWHQSVSDIYHAVLHICPSMSRSLYLAPSLVDSVPRTLHLIEIDVNRMCGLICFLPAVGEERILVPLLTVRKLPITQVKS
jgi:hypothetical protein